MRHYRLVDRVVLRRDDRQALLRHAREHDKCRSNSLRRGEQVLRNVDGARQRETAPLTADILLVVAYHEDDLCALLRRQRFRVGQVDDESFLYREQNRHRNYDTRACRERRVAVLEDA